MKVITVLGSPRKKGKTAEVLGYCEKSIMAQGHDIERINLNEHQISGCIGCYSCMKNQLEPGCILNDYAIEFFKKISDADVIVYSSPIYCFDMTAQLKTLIDRHFCLLNTNIPNGKRAAFVTTCGDNAQDNADLAGEVFRRCFDGEHGGKSNFTMVGYYVVDRSNAPDFSERAQVISDKLVFDILKFTPFKKCI